MNDFSPQIIQTEEGHDFVQQASSFLIKAIKSVASPLVALPTGSTPLGIYKEFASQYKNDAVWQDMRYIALDEYIGLPRDDERLFQNWIGRECLDFLGVEQDNRITFDSLAPDPASEVQRINEIIAAQGPIDIAVLGLGTNGHIAFNEPGSSFDSATRVIDLSDETRASNAEYWGGLDRVPTQAYTLGLKTLTDTKHIILLVTGAHKADILDKVLSGPITEDIPASILRTVPNVTVIADSPALKK